MSLTSELGDRSSPLRQFFEEELSTIKDVQRSFREGAGDLAVTPSGVNAGTMGGAADWILRFLLYPSPHFGLALTGAVLCGEPFMKALIELANVVGATTGRFRLGPAESPGVMLKRPEPEAGASNNTAFFTGPVKGSQVEHETLARACWALALLTEVYRAGRIAFVQGPLGALGGQSGLSGGDLLALAPTAAIEELVVFSDVFKTDLLPHLTDKAGRWTIGPTFDGSGTVGGADADFIADDLLVEVKTSLGRKRPDGSRACTLDKLDLFQIVGYALLDFSDSYGMRLAALYNARYRYFVSWNLEDLIHMMSNGRYDLGKAREKCSIIVGGSPA